MTEESRREEFAETAETLSEVAAEAGITDMAAGIDELETAGSLEELSKEELALGASDVTHGLDEMVVADRAAVDQQVLRPRPAREELVHPLGDAAGTYGFLCFLGQSGRRAGRQNLRGLHVRGHPGGD